jgi:hypothetical protein
VLLVGPVLSPTSAEAVRPFITDDARITDKGQVSIESFAELATSQGEHPAYGLHSLPAFGITDRLELTTGSVGAEFRDHRLTIDNLVLQPKVLLHQSFGAIPSVSTAVGLVLPISGNRQQWDTYAMAHVSWFLFRPAASPDPYDYLLAIYLNAGAKGRYDAGLGGRHTSKPFWAAGVEAGTFIRQVRFLAETFNGDPLDFAEEFPAYQTGFRWYKSPSVQIDIAWKGIKTARPGESREYWEHSLQIGLRIVLDLFR